PADRDDQPHHHHRGAADGLRVRERWAALPAPRGRGDRRVGHRHARHLLPAAGGLRPVRTTRRARRRVGASARRGSRHVIRWAAGRPAVVWATAMALCLAGAVAFTRLPLATRTTIELPRLQVQASWPGASAELVETYLTSPVEGAIQAVRGVRKTASTSVEGSASLTIELEQGTDVQMARLEILERLELLRPEFPAGATPPAVSNYVPAELDEPPLLEVTLSGPYTPGAL